MSLEARIALELAKNIEPKTDKTLERNTNYEYLLGKGYKDNLASTLADLSVKFDSSTSRLAKYITTGIITFGLPEYIINDAAHITNLDKKALIRTGYALAAITSPASSLQLAATTTPAISLAAEAIDPDNNLNFTINYAASLALKLLSIAKIALKYEIQGKYTPDYTQLFQYSTAPIMSTALFGKFIKKNREHIIDGSKELISTIANSLNNLEARADNYLDTISDTTANALQSSNPLTKYTYQTKFLNNNINQ